MINSDRRARDAAQLCDGRSRLLAAPHCQRDGQLFATPQAIPPSLNWCKTSAPRPPGPKLLRGVLHEPAAHRPQRYRLMPLSGWSRRQLCVSWCPAMMSGRAGWMIFGMPNQSKDAVANRWRLGLLHGSQKLAQRVGRQSLCPSEGSAPPPVRDRQGFPPLSAFEGNHRAGDGSEDAGYQCAKRRNDQRNASVVETAAFPAFPAFPSCHGWNPTERGI
jgi:hypothetical protein